MKRIILLLLLLLLLPACVTLQGTRSVTTPVISPSAPSAPSAAAATLPGGTAAVPPPTVTPLTLNLAPTADLPDPGAPDVADYNIAVALDPPRHLLTGKETITYRNTTQKPIPDLVFHLYLNGFKSPDTIFMKESGGQLRGQPFDAKNNGWIEVDALAIQDGADLKLELQQDGTLARAALPQPVEPGQVIRLAVSFHAQLPKVFARTGWALDSAKQPFFLVGQWFPKLGVWTESGWNAYPFHGNSEFFADFGRYDVAITLPAGYVTGAVGQPTGAASNATASNAAGMQTVTYSARGVIDFAWVASPSLKTAVRKAGSVEINYLYLPEHAWSVEDALSSAVDSLTYFGRWYGAYPYPRLTVVDVPEDGAGAGGMEYPTFVTAGASSRDPHPPSPWVDGLAITTIHEIGHQWFQSMVATNEAVEPWLDEGFADYSTIRLMIAKYGLPQSTLDQGDFPAGFLQSRRRRYLALPNLRMDGKAWDYTSWDQYTVAAYAKPDMALLTLERELGEPTMTKLLQTYAETYRYAHPTTADFQKVAVEVSGQPLDWFFNGLVDQGQTLDYQAKSIQGDSITVARQGDLVIPTEILVTFADGATQTVPWDGKDAQHTFNFDKTAPVQSFTIDPQHKLIIDLNWKDNSLKQ